VNRDTAGVNSLPKTVTRQRRDCDLNPDPSAPESSTLTTRLPSHPRLNTGGIYIYLLYAVPPLRYAPKRRSVGIGREYPRVAMQWTLVRSDVDRRCSVERDVGVNASYARDDQYGVNCTQMYRLLTTE